MPDETMSEETTTLSILNKTNNKLKFLYRQNSFLGPTLRRLLCKTILQTHFDYTCSAWYPNLTKKLEKLNSDFFEKCIYFCLQLGKMTHGYWTGYPWLKDSINALTQLFWLTDWLAGWLAGWLTDWLPDCLTAWLTDWLA